MAYKVGQVARLYTLEWSQEGVAGDPPVVQCLVKKPDGTTTTYTYLGGPEIQRDGPGLYYVDITLNAPGIWKYKWQGGAPWTSVEDGTLTVQTICV